MIGANHNLPGLPTVGGTIPVGDRSAKVATTAWAGVEFDPFRFGVASGVFLHLHEGPMANTQAIAFNVLYLYLYRLRDALTISRAAVRVNTGQANTAFKPVIVAHNPATVKPAATPVLRENTGIDTTSNGWPGFDLAANVTIPKGYVWLGGVFGDLSGSATLPTLKGPSGANTMLDGLYGDSAALNVSASGVGSSMIGLSTPWTYSTDLTTLDLTSVTWTRVVAAGGIPALIVKTA